MDLSGVSQSSCNKEVKNIGESPEQKSFSNNSDEIDSKSSTGDQLITGRSLVIPKTACLPTGNLGNLSVQTKSNSDTSASKISTSSSLSELNSEFKTDCRSPLESPTTHSSNCIPTCTRMTDPSVTTVVDDNMAGGTPDTTNRDFIEPHDKAVKEADILSIQSLPTTDPSISETTCQKVSSTTPTEEPNLLEQFENENDVPIEQELMGDACARYLRVRKINEQLRKEFQNKIDKFLSQNKAESEPSQDLEFTREVGEKYLRALKVNEQLREQFKIRIDKFASQNKADSTSNVIPEDNLFASTSTEDTN